MKKTIIYLILILLLSKINLYSQFSYQWETSQLDPPHEIFKSKFLDEYTGFATALKSSENKSKIIKTIDRGNSWSTVLSWSPYSVHTTPSELETSIDNPVAFSNTMVSAPFSLGPNDTLIMNGTGNYNYVSGETFTQKRFTVNLMRKSTQGIYLTLFSDSIGVADTVESEYLRGFVFDENNMPEVDSFYVQLVIDSNSLNPGDNYSVCNVYSPDEVYEGDNSNSHKRYVHFMNGKNNNNVIIPKVYSLSQNYPNPFNPVTNIKYQIPADRYVSLKIYDITGREIANLVKEYKQAGYYTVSFNGSNFASGVYFYRIQAGDFVQVKRMVLIK